MTKLEDKVSFALDETRMLILGAEVLLGFQYRAPLEKSFLQLPYWSQFLQMLALGLMIAVVGLLIAPSMFHCIVSRGNDTEESQSFATQTVKWALIPFAVSMGIEFLRSSSLLFSRNAALFWGALLMVMALLAWFILPCVTRKKSQSPHSKKEIDMSFHPTPIETRLKHVLTEARVMLPGAQALLGFQLIAFFMESFPALPDFCKYVHFGSTVLIAVTTIMLIAPAAYHRIVENGEATERAYQFAHTMVIGAGLPLAGGLGGDFLVVVFRTSGNIQAAMWAGFLAVIFCLGMWWFVPWARKGSSPSLEKK